MSPLQWQSTMCACYLQCYPLPQSELHSPPRLKSMRGMRGTLECQIEGELRSMGLEKIRKSNKREGGWKQ